MNQTNQQNNAIMPKEAQEKADEAASLLVIYTSLEVTTPPAYTAAGDDLKLLKSKWKELDALRKTMTKPLDESKNRIMEFFRGPLACLKEAQTAVSQAMVGYNQEQEKKRRLEEERIRAAQLKETARLAKLADAAKGRGDTDKATQFEQRSEDVAFAAPVVPTKVEKVAGLAMTKVWKHRIVDLSKLPRAYMIPNESLLGYTARTGRGLTPIPGVEFYSEDSMRGTR